MAICHGVSFHRRSAVTGTSILLTIEKDLVEQVVDIARRAGDAIMTIYATDFAIDTKDDRSPVTAADQAAEDVILAAIETQIARAIPVVSEEAASVGQIPVVDEKPFWLVDPMDGTKEFINHNGEFTVNIALIEQHTPILGVVHLPTQGTTFIGYAAGASIVRDGGTWERITCRPQPDAGLTALVSRSHHNSEVDDFLKELTVNEEISAGSSLKFCRVAEGIADIYPRLGRTMEWDTAAGHGVLKFAGGQVRQIDGKELTYGKPGFENPYFVAASDDVFDRLIY